MEARQLLNTSSHLPIFSDIQRDAAPADQGKARMHTNTDVEATYTYSLHY